MPVQSSFVGKTIERIEHASEMDETLTFHFTDGSSISITSSVGDEYMGEHSSRLVVW